MKGLLLKAAQVRADGRKKLKGRVLRPHWKYVAKGASAWQGDYERDGWEDADLHSVQRCRVYRIAEDVIAVTDGDGGYTPFHLPKLIDLLKEAESLPITTVRTGN